MIITVRKPRRHACTQCNGKGSKDQPGPSCEKCEGKGYIELPSGDDEICPTCNGDGYKMASRICNECKGKGSTVRIYEFKDYDNICLSCCGTGWIDEKSLYTDFYGEHVRHHQVLCPRCYGSGTVITYTHKTIG